MIPSQIKIASLAVFLICFTAGVRAQYDTVFNELLNEFDDFQEETASEFQSFISENDSLFLQFLEQSWKEYRMYELEREEKPKPVKQPVLQPQPDSSGKEIQTLPVKPVESPSDKEAVTLEVSQPVEYASLAVTKSFELFGTGFNIQYYPERLNRLESISEKSIRQYYRTLSDQSDLWSSNINALLTKVEQYRFNDWGYYLVLKEAARQLFPRQREQTLFIWYAFINSGYQMKLGYAGEDLYLLLPSVYELYDIPYLTDQGRKYYLFGSNWDPGEMITTYSGFPMDSSSIFSFLPEQLPVINNDERFTKTITYKESPLCLYFQKDLIDYLASLPQSVLELYYTVPLSASLLKTLDTVFLPLMTGKTAHQKVNLLLDFIQSAIPYQADREQFGAERYLFAEESLFYQGADCEDRTVLLMQLVKHYTGLPVISLEFPNHVTLAVHFPEPLFGDHVVNDGKDYYICDPTFIYARAGMLPADLKGEVPKILLVE